ncbi:PqqD family peptide modification chaperone [Clostridium sp. D2Q-14]|uniref:PqqD family peptide modification chaperone n=1 Tax=Anaeromonas gelatinilytica TaxID=2683194 RepID=UPI00193B8CFC|nr:PqqD family peptide modification chaperone [Anaeromonas gelatinilytica]MBS4535686.1 PqqD family peptide modification chaperone [Anaeromonas gelatinilytica]
MNFKFNWKRIKVSECITKKVDDVYVVYPIKPKRDCIMIGGIGYEIWNALTNSIPLENFIDKMLSKYEVEKEELIQDINNFLTSLKTANLIIIDGIEEKFKLQTNEFKTTRIVSSDHNDNYVNERYLKLSKPYKVFLELTYNCNLKCEHCYLGKETYMSPEFMDYETALRVIDELVENELVELVITGGEALLHPQLFEILEYACENELIVTLLTNGTIISDEKIESLKKLNLYDIRISIYGMEEFHDSFVKMKGAFKKSVKALKELRKNFKIGTAVCILSKDNYEHSKELELYMNNNNIPIDISPVIFPTISGDLEPTLLRMTENQVIDSIVNRGFKVGGNICTAGISRFRITPTGEVNPCEMLRSISLGNINDLSFTEILNSESRQEWIKTFRTLKNTKCDKCNKKNYCFNCPGIAYLETGNLNGISKYPCKLAHIQKDYYENQSCNTSI